MFHCKYHCKVYPEEQSINKTIPIIKFGFMFIERKRRKRILKIIRMRSQTIELDNIDMNVI